MPSSTAETIGILDDGKHVQDQRRSTGDNDSTMAQQVGVETSSLICFDWSHLTADNRSSVM